MSEPQGAAHGARYATGQAPSPYIPPLAQCGNEGAQRRKRLLGSSPQTLAQEDDIITKRNREEEFLNVH